MEGKIMIMKACRTATKRENVIVSDIYETSKWIAEDHPQIGKIINQVRNSDRLSVEDKNYFEKELLTMAGILYEVENYTLVVGKTCGTFVGDSGYSYARLHASKNLETVVNETSFTIVSYGKDDDWAAYVDLPIDVEL